MGITSLAMICIDSRIYSCSKTDKFDIDRISQARLLLGGSLFG